MRFFVDMQQEKKKYRKWESENKGRRKWKGFWFVSDFFSYHVMILLFCYDRSLH